MATPELLVIPSTPHTAPSTNSHTQSSGSFRSSSEDTAVTIFSMYTDARENWAANTKVLSLNDVERSSRHGIDPSSSAAWRGTPDARPRTANGSSFTKVAKPPSAFQGGLVVLDRHSIATTCRASEESTSLPYTRDSMLLQDTPPPPPSEHLSEHRHSPPTAPSPLLSPRPGPSGPSPDPSIFTQRSEGEDADSFHIRSTYAQLEVEGVRGDGYEEGVELTRAKQGGTTYLTSQPHDRGRDTDLHPEELAVLASVDRFVPSSL